MKKNRKPETVDTVEREREREPLFIQRGIRLLDHTHTQGIYKKETKRQPN